MKRERISLNVCLRWNREYHSLVTSNSPKQLTVDEHAPRFNFLISYTLYIIRYCPMSHKGIIMGKIIPILFPLTKNFQYFGLKTKKNFEEEMNKPFVSFNFCKVLLRICSSLLRIFMNIVSLLHFLKVWFVKVFPYSWIYKFSKTVSLDLVG